MPVGRAGTGAGQRRGVERVESPEVLARAKENPRLKGIKPGVKPHWIKAPAQGGEAGDETV